MPGIEAHPGNIYALIDGISREKAAAVHIPDEVRMFAVTVAGDIVTMSDEETMMAAMELDASTRTGDEQVIKELIQSGNPVEAYSDMVKNPRREYPDLEQAEAHALACLRMELAFLRFRLEYPEKFNVMGTGYYASEAFFRGSYLARGIVADYLSEGSKA